MIVNHKEKEIEGEITRVIELLNIEYMPSKGDLLKINKGSLASKIEKNGGYNYWRKKMNLDKKIKRHSWSLDEAFSKVLEVSMHISDEELLMPTRKQMIDYFGNNKLASFLSHEYGRSGLTYRIISGELGLKLQDSETELGNRYEIIAMKMLKEKGFTVTSTSSGEEYDLLVNNKRVEVKCGRAYFNKTFRAHTFGLNKINPTSEFHIIFALSEDGEDIEKVLVIPSDKLRMKTLNIGANSKYDIYLDRYDLLV